MHDIKVALGVLFLALVTLVGCDGRKPSTDTRTEGSAPESSAADDASPAGDSNDMGQEAANGGESDTLWVMQARGNRQCEGGGVTLEESRVSLQGSGISVSESRCAVRTDRMYPSVCGGATGDILVHRIPSTMLDAALELEFDPADKVPHNFTECPADKEAGAKPTR